MPPFIRPDAASVKEMERLMRPLAKLIEQHIPAGWGFCLVLGTYDKEELPEELAGVVLFMRQPCRPQCVQAVLGADLRVA